MRGRTKCQVQRRQQRQKVRDFLVLYSHNPDQQNIFLAAKNEGERGLTLTQTSDTGHTGHTDDNTGSWFHSQNILHVTFLGLVVIL